MKTYKTVTVKKEVFDEIFCNMCGEKIPTDKLGYVKDHLNIVKTWGYNSNYDGEEHSFDICAECYGKLINQFVIKI